MEGKGMFANKPTFTRLSSWSSISHLLGHPKQSIYTIKTLAKSCVIKSCSHANPIPSHPPYMPSNIPDPKYVRIMDTTLRYSNQPPEARMRFGGKLDIAHQLAKLKVDIIDVGFPAASEDNFSSARMIVEDVGDTVDGDGYVPVICGSSRCNEEDIKITWNAVRYAKRPRLRVALNYEEVTDNETLVAYARSMVVYARSLGCDDLEFNLEDAVGRSEREFLYNIFGEVINAGATTLSVSDTMGISLPNEFGELISDVKANTRRIEDVVISTRCKNDLGLATANSIAGAYAGARQLEVTINGIGERAGNAPLEEVVVALKCRREHIGGLYTGIDTHHISLTSKRVEEYLGLKVQRYKPIVGPNTFAHESSIHEDGTLQNKGLFEIIAPEDIGLERSNEASMVLEDFSGLPDMLMLKLIELGFRFKTEQFLNIYVHYLAVAAHKKRVTLSDLRALVLDELWQPESKWKLFGLEVTTSQILGPSSATVKLIDADGKEHEARSNGTGPVDSAYKAIDLIVKVPVKLLEYSMSTVTEGSDAIATIHVLIRAARDDQSEHPLTQEPRHLTFSGTGASMDIVVASVKAYIGALNKMLTLLDLFPLAGPPE